MKTGLNIGCGGRPFKSTDNERWINVDVIDEIMAGYEYVKSDARKLPFDADSIDVVFSCHVIEHFWPWEVANVIMEWKRVIKPGGSLVTECPNILNSLGLIAIGVNNDNTQMYSLGMNGLYGDPNDYDLAMRHKWGYTPKTLSSLLTSAGFVDAMEVPAQYKQAKIRDMRIVATKP